MKRFFQHPPQVESGRKYWRSLEEQAGTPEFQSWLEREFPAGAAEMEMDGVSRRSFLRLMGASLALAGFGVSGCRRPEAYITPFSKSVEWMIPGKALFYASAMPTRKGAIPLVVTTYDGRPTKIEGNPLHPASNGATDGFAQASVLGVYDPDRSRRFRDPSGKSSTLEAFREYLATLLPELAADGGAGLAFLLGQEDSPSRARLLRELAQKYPGAKFCVFEPVADTAAAEATKIGFGPGVKLSLNVAAADVILSLGNDFLGADGLLEDTRQFASRRRAGNPDGLNRLYVAENRYTLTGAMADHRLRLRAADIPAFAAALAKEIAGLAGTPDLARMADAIEGAPAGLDPQWVSECAKDLVENRGAGLVLAGPQQPVQIHLLAHAINTALGNVGRTCRLFEASEVEETLTLTELAGHIDAGAVRTLVISGGNPAYNAPADLAWETLQHRVEHTIRLGAYEDETSRASKWHVPAAHYLESWGDALTPDGTLVPVQPMILPLFGGLSELELLVLLAGRELPDGPELVRETFRDIANANDFESAWTAFLRDGFLPESAALRAERPFNASAAGAYLSTNRFAAAGSGIELVFVADSKIDDGRYINNGWLQELPDPITKLTWDNAAWISPATAAALGVAMHAMAADTLEIESNGITVTLPIIVCPGHADDSITLPLGYGQELAGRVGSGTGTNVYPLRTTTAPHVLTGARVAATGEKVDLAITHGHWTMEGRELFREAPVDHYRDHPTFAQTMGMDGHIPPDISLYRSPPLDAPEQWGMVVDLGTCTGCNACVVACQSENNIPIVGKEQVIHHREMHWIRIDRYFATVNDADPNPAVGMQPVTCMHCENAPCETVCPVNATVHSEDGLNVMVYNRCIGTRYCANNCPYKVRRFNFFDYNKRKIGRSKIGPIETSNLYLGPLGKKQETALTGMQKNPNVTVRMRGVMEKCTFCVQRIEEARIQSKVKAGPSPNVQIPTDRIKTACQQVCAAEAIVFGDIADPESQVARLKENNLDFVLLKYLNIRPRLSYHARLRNPNPAMPGAETVGWINGQPAAGHH